MLKKHDVLYYLRFSSLAAIAYCIVAFIFIHDDSYSQSYILYIGNMLFACCIISFILIYNKKRKENALTTQMVFAGHLTTIMGILLSCIICLGLLLIFHPEIFHSASTNNSLNDFAQMKHKSHDTLFILFMNTVFGNISVGSFFSIIIPYAAKINQKGSTSVVKNKSNNDLTVK